MDKTNYTIKDIAKLAKVSAGTVDRVIHKRGRVSEKALRQVKKVLEEINYEPNVLAKSLKNQKTYRIHAIMPHREQDQYWSEVHAGIDQFEREHRGFTIHIEHFPFRSDDPVSFLAQSKQITANTPDAVLVAPLFDKESHAFLRTLKALEIPFITINNEIKDISPLSHTGQDLITSGRTAAHLIHQCARQLKSALIIHLSENPYNAPHMKTKQAGFEQYFQDKGVAVQTIFLKARNTNNLDQSLQQLKVSNDVNGVFVTTSKAHVVAPQLKAIYPDATIVGFDLVDKNIALLKEDVIDFLINQNPEKLAYQSLLRFVDSLIFHKEVKSRHYLPIDIVTKENLESYIRVD